MKIARTVVTTMAVAAWTALPASGNAGGYFRGGVESTGTVAGFEPTATGNVRILDEKLTVSLGTTEAEVEVRYLMRNETKSRVKVRFGFPVEETYDAGLLLGNGVAGVEPGKTWAQPKYCQVYQVSAGGKPLAARFEGETNVAINGKFKGIRGWMVSELTYQAGEEVPLRVTFRSSYSEEHMGYPGGGYQSAEMFRYRLSTGACWAGTIGTGRIALKPAGIDPRLLSVIKPVNRFHKEGDSWVWDFENLKPTQADDLVICAVPDEHSLHQSGETYTERDHVWLMEHQNYAVKASSTLPPEGDYRYDAENLKGAGDLDAWAEGKPGSGIGEWIEVRPVVAKPLNSLWIRPGFAKSEELFRANARPKRIKVELNGGHALVVDVPDKNAAFCIPITGFNKPVEVVKLTFVDVWNGSKYEDLCLSRLVLVAKLDRKPKMEPVR